MTQAVTVVADPPWPFRDRLLGAGRGAATHYSLLTLHDIKRFQLPDLDPAGCWLFLWRVASMQGEALEVAAAWGFTPKGEIVWVKTTNDGSRPRIGMGHYLRNAHETCLVAVRGKPQRLSNAVGHPEGSTPGSRTASSTSSNRSPRGPRRAGSGACLERRAGVVCGQDVRVQVGRLTRRSRGSTTSGAMRSEIEALRQF